MFNPTLNTHYTTKKNKTQTRNIAAKNVHTHIHESNPKHMNVGHTHTHTQDTLTTYY